MSTQELAYEAQYSSMEQATSEDMKHILKGLSHYTQPDYLTEIYCGLLERLKDSKDGFPINRFDHSLQSATMAHRDGKSTEYVVCALLHDIGEIFDPYSH